MYHGLQIAKFDVPSQGYGDFLGKLLLHTFWFLGLGICVYIHHRMYILLDLSYMNVLKIKLLFIPSGFGDNGRRQNIGIHQEFHSSFRRFHYNLDK